jgi:tetratricopeptide (TPR) repeat protein
VTPQKAFDQLAAIVARKVGPAADQTVETYRSFLTMGLPDDQVVTMLTQAHDQFVTIPDYGGAVAAPSVLADTGPMPTDSNSAYNEGLALMQSIESQLRSQSLDGDGYGAAMRAEQLFRHTLTLAPNHGRAATMLGMLLKFQTRVDEAIPLLQPVIDPETGLDAGSPDWLIAATTLGESHMLRNDAASAARVFEQILAHTPDDPDRLYQLGVCYSALNRSADAVEVLTKASKLAPKNADIKAALVAAKR